MDKIKGVSDDAGAPFLMSKIIELKIFFCSHPRVFPHFLTMFQTYALQIYVCHDTVFQTFYGIKSKS